MRNKNYNFVGKRVVSMHEIICPHCHEKFSLDNADYLNIVQQVRTKEFEQDLCSRLNIAVDKALSEQQQTFREQIDALQHEVDYYKNLKLQMSTKMIGETLEKHCENEFNKIRMSAFPNAYFEKDNDSSSGSKGDYIFRECDAESDCEIISVMFEMKNEMDSTEKKHKNEDFFKKLDADRRRKNCEYAVLVSMLEADNDFYNQGIADVSWKYPKMYVIRPQFFIPFLTFLRNNALSGFEYKRQLIAMQKQNEIAVLSDFEKSIDTFRSSFVKPMSFANDKMDDSIKTIDRAITSLQKTRENLIACRDYMNRASDAADILFETKV